MAYLIDSDWTIDHLNNVLEAVTLVQALIPEGVFISAITYLEAFEGTLRDADSRVSAENLSKFTTTRLYSTLELQSRNAVPGFETKSGARDDESTPGRSIW